MALLLERRASAWAAKAQLCSWTVQTRTGGFALSLWDSLLFPLEHWGDCSLAKRGSALSQAHVVTDNKPCRVSEEAALGSQTPRL